MKAGKNKSFIGVTHEKTISTPQLMGRRERSADVFCLVCLCVRVRVCVFFLKPYCNFIPPLLLIRQGFAILICLPRRHGP